MSACSPSSGEMGRESGMGSSCMGRESHTTVNIPRCRSFRLFVAGSVADHLLRGVLLWDQPVELRGGRKLHAFELPEQAHGHRLSRVRLEEGLGSGKHTPVFINSISKFEKPKPNCGDWWRKTASDWSKAWLTHIDSELRKDLLLELTLRFMSASGRERKKRTLFKQEWSSKNKRNKNNQAQLAL